MFPSVMQVPDLSGCAASLIYLNIGPVNHTNSPAFTHNLTNLERLQLSEMPMFTLDVLFTSTWPNSPLPSLRQLRLFAMSGEAATELDSRRFPKSIHMDQMAVTNADKISHINELPQI